MTFDIFLRSIKDWVVFFYFHRFLTIKVIPAPLRLSVYNYKVPFFVILFVILYNGVTTF